MVEKKKTCEIIVFCDYEFMDLLSPKPNCVQPNTYIISNCEKATRVRWKSTRDTAVHKNSLKMINFILKIV